MRDFGRSIARRMPRLANAVWNAVFPHLGKDVHWDGSEHGADRQNTFEKIFTSNSWNSAESRSGHGSTLDQTIFIRSRLPVIVGELGAKSLLDAPCGDYHWMQHVRLPGGVSYTGGEIVRPLVADLEAGFARPGVRFIPLDIVADPLPAADLWLCRDALFHFSYADIFASLRNFAQSEIAHLLTTTYPHAAANRDIASGGFRFLNLRLPPFSLPEPRLQFDDFLAPETPRKLALWSREDVAAALEQGAQ